MSGIRIPDTLISAATEFVAIYITAGTGTLPIFFTVTQASL